MADSRLAFDIVARGGTSAAAEFEKVARGADRAGGAMKKNQAVSDAVAKATANLTKAHNSETTALDRVQIAEQKLAEVRKNGNAKVSQVLTAEKALAKARREAAVAGDAAQKATKELGEALDNEGDKAGKSLGSGLKKWFTGDGKNVFKQVGEDGGTVFGSGIAGALKTPVLGPAIIAGLGAAVAVAAPAVGAIAAAGIATGFGVGIGALGLVFATKSVAVKNEWNRTLSSMAADMKVLSKPFEATLISMSGVAKRTFATFKPQLDAAFKTLAPSFTAFGDQLGRALERPAPAFGPLADAADAALKSLGGALPDIVGRLSNQLIDLSNSVSRNPAGLRDLATALGSLTDGTLKTITVLNDINGVLKKIPGGFSFFTGLPGKLSPVKGSFDALFGSISRVSDLLAGSTVNSKQLADVIGKSGAAVTAYAQAAGGAGAGLNKQADAAARSAHETHAANQAAYLLATAFDRQSAATQKSIDVLNRRSNLLLSLSGAEIGFQQAIDDATASIKENGRTHDINTQKGRNNKLALDQVAASAITQRDAMLKANDGNVKAAGAAETGRAAYVKLATQMGYSKAEARAMAAQFIAIPNVTRTAKIKANVAELESQLKTVKAKLADKDLTKERRAKLTATKADLEKKVKDAKALLAAPALVATKTAKLQATKKALDDKLAAAKKALADNALIKTRTAKLDADKRALERKVNEAQAKVNSLKGKTVVITYTAAGVISTSTGRSTGRRSSGGGDLLASGGKIHGPGTGTSDTAGTFRLSNNEWVVRAASAQKYGDKAMRSVNDGTATVIPGLATGGPVVNIHSQGIFKNVASLRKVLGTAMGGPALSWAKSQAGKPYVWGGVGPGGYDCSGFMSAIVNVIRGQNPHRRLFATGSMPGGLFEKGVGRFNVGWFKGNPGHTAGTLNGVNVESRGGRGVVVGPGARGANDRLFNSGVWHLKGFAKGGKVTGDPPYDGFGEWLQNLESYAKGTSYVPRDGLAYLHRGERVTPAAQNSGAQTVELTLRVAPGGDSALAQVVHNLVRTGVIQLAVGGKPVRVAGR